MSLVEKNIEKEFRKASFFQRMIAGTIDIILLGVIFSFNELYIVSQFNTKGKFDISLLFFYWLLVNAYFSVLHAKTGYTFGKKIIKIKVVDLCGKNITFIQSFIRTFAYCLSAQGLLGWLWILVDKKNQSFHDKIAKTYVILL